MKPLSTFQFFRHNKRKLFSNVMIIVVAICLVYLMECFIASIAGSVYPLDANRFHYGMVVVSTSAVPVIPRETVEKLESSDSIDTTVPVAIEKITFSVPGSTTHTAAFGCTKVNQKLLLERFEMKLSSGRLPEEGTNELAVDKNVAMNNNLQIGSWAGSKYDKTQSLRGDYKVVGILESESHISLIGSPTPGDKSIQYGDSGRISSGRWIKRSRKRGSRFEPPGDAGLDTGIVRQNLCEKPADISDTGYDGGTCGFGNGNLPGVFQLCAAFFQKK